MSAGPNGWTVNEIAETVKRTARTMGVIDWSGQMLSTVYMLHACVPILLRMLMADAHFWITLGIWSTRRVCNSCSQRLEVGGLLGQIQKKPDHLLAVAAECQECGDFVHVPCCGIHQRKCWGRWLAGETGDNAPDLARRIVTI